MTADAREKLAAALYDLIVDHPMWIDGQGRGLDYSPEREARIGDFLEAAVEIAGKRAAEELRAAADEDSVGLAGLRVVKTGELLDRAAALDPDPDPEPVAHNHTRFRNVDGGPWSPCPASCPAAGLLR